MVKLTRSMNRVGFGLVSCASLLLPLQLHGQVFVLDTLENPSVGWFGIADPSTKGAMDVAYSFTTGSQPLTLDSVTLKLEVVGAGSGGITVTMFSDGGGAPGYAMQTLTGPSDPSPGHTLLTTVDAVYAGNMRLAPNTTYWVEARTMDGQDSGYGWPVSNSRQNGGSGTLGIIRNGSASANPYWWGTDASQTLLVRVAATAVPEPVSAAAVAAIGLLGFAVVRHRRKAGAPQPERRTQCRACHNSTVIQP